MKKLFYGWYVVLASMILLAVGLGMFNSTNSVFVKPICNSLGFSRGEFTLYRTIITLLGAVLMPFYGQIISKIGVKKVMTAGAVMLGLAIGSYSIASRLWHFYLIAAVNGIFFNSISFMSVGVLVNNWFDGKKGLAMGLAFSGSGLGGAIMVPVIGRVIEITNWRTAYLFMGVLGVVILLPVILVLVENKPEDINLKPYPAKSMEHSSNAKSIKGGDLSLRMAMGQKKFWVLLMAFLLMNAFAAATNTHSAPYLSDLGYDTVFVSTVISLFMLCMTGGKVLLGVIYDRFGVFVGNLIIAVACLVFPAFALLASIPAFAWAYAVSIGIASCGISVPLTLLLVRYFGQGHFPAIFSFVSMVCTFAQAISVPAMGAVSDYMGSYRPAWIAFVLFGIIISICLIGVEISFNKTPKRICSENCVFEQS